MIVFIIASAVVKAVALRSLVHHPTTVFVVCGLIAFLSLLRGRLMTTAFAGAVIAAVALSPGSVGVGVVIGVVAFAALMVLCVAIGTLLNITDARASERAR